MRSLPNNPVLILTGVACLVIVVLTHIAEKFHIFPAMGWGQRNSLGHYLDLVSAGLGCILLSLGLVARYSRRNSN